MLALFYLDYLSCRVFFEKIAVYFIIPIISGCGIIKNQKSKYYCLILCCRNKKSMVFLESILFSQKVLKLRWFAAFLATSMCIRKFWKTHLFYPQKKDPLLYDSVSKISPSTRTLCDIRKGPMSAVSMRILTSSVNRFPKDLCACVEKQQLRPPYWMNH